MSLGLVFVSIFDFSVVSVELGWPAATPDTPLDCSRQRSLWLRMREPES